MLFRVKCVKYSFLGFFLLVEMFKGYKNMVLLIWKFFDLVFEILFIYWLEWQEVGFEDWIQCFSIEKVGVVEVLGDCVFFEGDYCF